MVFSWFKKRGGDNSSAKARKGAGPSTGKNADKRADGKVATRVDAADNSAQRTAKATASNPLALAAADVLEAQDTEQAQHALAQLKDPAVITYVALQKGDLRDAALALPQMRSEAALQAMEKQSREHNKSINRFARNALERIKTARRESSELRARGDELNNALSKHNNETQAQTLTYAQRKAVVTQLQNEHFTNATQYQQVVTNLAECDVTLERFPPMVVVKIEPPEPEPSPEVAEPVAQIIEAVISDADAIQLLDCEQLLQALADLRQPLAKESQTASPAAFADLMTQLPQLQQRWQDLGLASPANVSLSKVPELNEAASNIQTQLSELEILATACVALDELAQADPAPALPSRTSIDLTKPSDAALSAFSSYQEAVTAASKAIKQQLRKLRWPEWAQTNASIAAPFARRDTLQAEQRWIDEQNQGLNGQLETALDVLTETLDGGQAAQSKIQMGQVRRLKQAVGKLDPAHNARLNTLNSRLTELVDWQTFATSPKRQELLDAITQIANEPLAPEAQANRVKLLRAQWNELGTASKGADRRLADGFNAQAQIAFDHCREHFAELAAQRSANSVQREQICQQLSDYLNATDLNNGDLKAAEQILRTARDAWRQCYPVERKTAKPLEKKFEYLQQQLHDNIKAVWANNEAAKQTLLTSAQALAASTDSDLNERINQAKGLQRDWQQIGPMPRGGERKLWLAFREACDALFSERDGAKQQQQVADQAAVTALTAQVDTFAEQLAKTTATHASMEQLRTARKAFSDAQGSLPGGAYSQLKRRFDGLCKDYETLLQTRKRQALHQRIDDLAVWDTTSTNTGTDAAIETDDDNKLLQGLSAAPAAAPTFESLQRLVLIAEILAEVPSPAAEEALRLQVQVERLQQTMGQKGAVDSASGDAHWVNLALQWCAQRPKPQGEAVISLRERYFAALRSALSPR